MQYVFAMQALVELSAQANHSADGLCGFAVDLQRCFNDLRREPVTLIAKALGISDKVLNPWLDFLHNNQRRFVVRGSLSSPIGSSVGFPEGCPLSVAAMTMINLSYHLYMQAFAPSTLAYSYVDNLAATAYSPATLARGWCALESFCNMFALPIDYNKSFVWAASATDRKSLQPFPCRTVRNARDLGGCMTYGSSLRNAGLVDRCRGLSGKWQALRRAPGPLEVKARTLWTCFWPRALHGIVTCLLGAQHIRRLRSAAVAALSLKCAGGNPMLRLALALPFQADPGFYQALTVFRDFRRICRKQPAHVNEWTQFMRHFDGRLLPGPFSKLLEICDPLPYITDHDGLHFNLLTCSSNELTSRLEDAWAQYVAQQVRHRNSMSDLNGIDHACSTRRRSKYTSLQARLVSAVQDGSFRAPAHHARYDLTKSAQCPLCLVPEDYKHQVCDCPRYRTCRAEDQWVADMWDSLPTCVSHHLLVPRNPFFVNIKEQLHYTADSSGEFHLEPDGAQLQHVFTDGSCFGHQDSQLALAAWAAIAPDRGCIAAGHLSGTVQTISRAELTAVISAIRWTIKHNCRTCVWSDSQSTVHGIDALLHEPIEAPSGENEDLWHAAADLLRTTTAGTFQIRWIPAHLQEADCESPFEEWVACGNNQADHAAVAANRTVPLILCTCTARPSSFSSTGPKHVMRWSASTSASHSALVLRARTCKSTNRKNLIQLSSPLGLPCNGMTAKAFGPIFCLRTGPHLARQNCRTSLVASCGSSSSGFWP